MVWSVDAGGAVTGPEQWQNPPGVRLSTSPDGIELSRHSPGPQPVYYRLGRGRLEWSTELAGLRRAGEASAVDYGALLALVHGLPEPPDFTGVPGVQRLTAGTAVRVDAAGVSVSSRPPVIPQSRQSLEAAVREVLNELPDGFTIAYSGGVASTFLAVCSAAQQAKLVHAVLDGLPGTQPVPPNIPGRHTERVTIDLVTALAPHQVTGEEITPPLPEAALRRHVAAAIAAVSDGPVVSGSVLESLLTANLPDLPLGLAGRRLLTCEPFHLSGQLPRLRDARDFLVALGEGVERRQVAAVPDGGEAESQPVGIAPVRSGTDLYGDGLPGLTEDGREALRSARLGASAVWRKHLEGLPAALGRADAEFASHDGEGSLQFLPALDDRVLGAIAAIPPRRLAGIKHGLVRNQLPLQKAIERHGVRGVHGQSAGFRARLAAAGYLHQVREKVAIDLARECPLADLGLLDPEPVIRLLDDGQLTADRALTILRLVWINQWLLTR
ncbi:hypothetical protein GCM10029976_008990 [Kribbella albertanoniae]|uniref:Asparagine synthase n=1 Tax=Kribbella albertanoniae TaxID=1266829 RepID=A0A4R4Q4X1_9ACTN|nr:hypothetical protein [Kribbella albertanoniae]TDC30191.1 hypothetical protein E1261_13955 [Kribbella albertanoniae]